MVEGRNRKNRTLKCINWNVNGLRAVAKKGFADFFQKENADIFALEEIKMTADQLPKDLQFSGYHQYINPAQRKGYSGTMIYTRQEPLHVLYDIPGDSTKEGRVITLEFPEYWFVAAYVPNAKEGLVRLSFRMEWEDHLRAHLKKLDTRKPVIYTGDLNVAHEDIDLKNPKTNHTNAGFSDDERRMMSQFLGKGFGLEATDEPKGGFIDTFRELYPDTVTYSWWSYRFQARAKNTGWRIDYFIASERLRDRIKDATIHTDILGSDHCPVGLELY